MCRKTQNERIQKFRLSNPCPIDTTQVVAGVCFVTKWGSPGSGNGEFFSPSSVALDSLGNVYVASFWEMTGFKSLVVMVYFYQNSVSFGFR